jgi:plastocyanin
MPEQSALSHCRDAGLSSAAQIAEIRGEQQVKPTIFSRRRTWAAIALSASTFGLSGAAIAADAPISLTIKDHKFSPAEIRVPAGQAAVLKIKNEDATAEEFESKALKIEKVIAGGKEGTVHLPALKAGSYPFVGEHHEDTAKGVVIVE